MWVYAKVEKWYTICHFFVTKETMKHAAQRGRPRRWNPKRSPHCVHLIKEDLGLPAAARIRQARQRRQLSTRETGTFHFSDGDVTLNTTVERSAFESWIAEELGQIGKRSGRPL